MQRWSDAYGDGVMEMEWWTARDGVMKRWSNGEMESDESQF